MRLSVLQPVLTVLIMFQCVGALACNTYDDPESRPIVSGTVNGMDILKIVSPTDQGITSFDFIPGVGASTLSLNARIGKKTYEVFPGRELSELANGLKVDPNFAFKRLNTPLFPNTNRLLPDESGNWRAGDEFTAEVLGVKVKMPLNNVNTDPAFTGTKVPHQLHGLLFDRSPTKVLTPTPSSSYAEFDNFFKGLWNGQARVGIEQSIEAGAFIYRMKATNTGAEAIPVGFGTHPYFKMNSKQMQLVIPAKYAAELDNYYNVLPTGKLISTAGTRLDFNPGNRTKINELYDNYFILDEGQRQVELIDYDSKIKYRMTALTKNIIGVQIFYPGQGDIIAIEMVTHHPDPRKAIWGDRDTGMQLLSPGESAEYAYKIEVLPL